MILICGFGVEKFIPEDVGLISVDVDEGEGSGFDVN